MAVTHKEGSVELKEEHVEVQSTTSNNAKDPTGEPLEGDGDYSGAREKTDPLEIKLVRKIDRRLLVSLYT